MAEWLTFTFPLTGRSAARTCSEGLGRSTVAHFARKVRGANLVAAKHELKIQQSNAPERWPCSLRVRGPHFASKVSYNAGVATSDCAGLRGLKAQQVSSPGRCHGLRTGCPFRALLFALCSFIMCGIAARDPARTFSGGLRRRTIAHFARKVRGRILWRPSMS